MPNAMLSSGSTVAMAGRLAVSGPARKATWLSSRPAAPEAMTAYSCQLVRTGTGPRSAMFVTDFSRAAVAA
jgi:hypothetical protein